MTLAPYQLAAVEAIKADRRITPTPRTGKPMNLADYSPAELAAEAARLNAHLQTLAAAQEQSVVHLLDAALNGVETVASPKFAGRKNVSHAARILKADIEAARARYAHALAVSK